jgi:predicted CoA-binding protein
MPSMSRDFLVSDPDGIREILSSARTIAVIGLSSSTTRPSHDVTTYLQSVGYRIVPINPNEQEVLGERCYPDLDAVPKEVVIDLVDVFRRPEEVMPHVDETIRRGTVKCIWLQDGVINWDAAERAHAAGLKVVMDDCTFRRHMQLIGRRQT